MAAVSLGKAYVVSDRGADDLLRLDREDGYRMTPGFHSQAADPRRLAELNAALKASARAKRVNG